MYNIYASAGYSGYLYPLIASGMFKEVEEIEMADAVLFAGGSDIGPELYGQKKGRLTYTNPRRDTIEVADYNYATFNGIPIIGVCRGMQLFTALEGGTLFQHVDNHAGDRHMMMTDEGENLRVNSLHHQMCNPWDGVEEFRLLGWSPSHLAGTIIGAGDLYVDPPPVEPEAIYYPKSKAFAVQWHPEMMNRSNPSDKIAIDWFVNHAVQLMEGTLKKAA